MARPDREVYSGAAPDLSHLMSRNAFAGASQADRDGLLVFLQSLRTPTAPASDLTR